MANKVSIVSLGCPKNLVDSDNLAKSLISKGFSYLHAPADADILLINTCGFIEDAKKESIEEILRLASLKANGKKLIVFGCLAKRYRDELMKEIPEIDAIYGIGEEEKIVEYCKKIKGSRSQGVKGSGVRLSGFAEAKKASLPESSNPRILEPSQSYAYLKIADGCNKKCTYCVIPSIRGNYRSIAPDKIIKEAERFIKAGVKELILVAQDTACYGKDLNPPEADNIASLLKDLCSISGDFWIRLLYAYPVSISESLINVIAEEDKICKYLDIPFQHSENRILRLMRRGGTRKEYLNLIRNVRHNIPDVALRTTFIVGFPSETEEEFDSLIDFIEEVRFDRLGVFKYSKEEGTSASKLKGHLTEAVKNRRFDKIMKHQSHISLEKNKKLIGRRFKAIVDEISDGIAIGRLYSHAPDIDGVVIIESAEAQKRRSTEVKDFQTSKLLNFRTSELKVGDFINVEITDAFDYDLKGILLDRVK